MRRRAEREDDQLARPHQQLVAFGAAEQFVAVGFAEQVVAELAAVDDVVSLAGADDVSAGFPVDRVVPARADDEVGVPPPLNVPAALMRVTS